MSDEALIAAALRRLANSLARRPALPFIDFLRKAWNVIEPGKPLIEDWHVGYLCELLTAVSMGQITRLLFNIGPRSTKSTIVSVAWPAWEWGPCKKPELRYMFISHEPSLSIEHSINRRLIIESDWYRNEWGGHVVLSSDQNEKKLIHNTRRGKMISTSTHGSATGKGGDRLVFDDFIDPEMAESDAERTAAIRAYETKFLSRLDDPKRGAMVVVEQRLHPKDFTAKLLEEQGWMHVVIPSDNYKAEPLRYAFPISGRVIEIPPGAATMPLRKPMDVVLGERRAMGSRTHDSQHRQNPADDAGAIFKRHLWRFYDRLPTTMDPESGKEVKWQADQVVQSWDCAFKDEADSDFVVGQVWARKGADRYLLDQTRDRLDISATIRAVEAMSQKWPQSHAKLVEDKANGPAVIQLLKRKVPGLLARNPEGGKIVRARAVEPIQESGNLWLPTPAIAPWIGDFIERAAKFPNVDYDDEVDAMTQANIYFTERARPSLSIQ